MTRHPVLDPHDAQALAAAVYRGAAQDLQHEGSRCPGKPNCPRGGHVCDVCGRMIWECARRALSDLEDRLAEYGVSSILGAACGVCGTTFRGGTCPRAGQIGHTYLALPPDDAPQAQ